MNYMCASIAGLGVRASFKFKMVAVGIIISSIKKSPGTGCRAGPTTWCQTGPIGEKRTHRFSIQARRNWSHAKTRGRANVISHILTRAFMHAHTQSCSPRQWNHCVKSLSYRGGGDIPSSGCLSHKSRSNQS